MDARSGRQYESVVGEESAAFVLAFDRYCHVVQILFQAGSCHSTADASVGDLGPARQLLLPEQLTNSSFSINNNMIGGQ